LAEVGIRELVKLPLKPFCKCSRRVRGYYQHNYN